MTDTHRTRVFAPPDDDGSVSWRCTCGETGSVSDYDAEFLALKQAGEHVLSAEVGRPPR